MKAALPGDAPAALKDYLFTQQALPDSSSLDSPPLLLPISSAGDNYESGRPSTLLPLPVPNDSSGWDLLCNTFSEDIVHVAGLTYPVQATHFLENWQPPVVAVVCNLGWRYFCISLRPSSVGGLPFKPFSKEMAFLQRGSGEDSFPCLPEMSPVVAALCCPQHLLWYAELRLP